MAAGDEVSAEDGRSDTRHVEDNTDNLNLKGKDDFIEDSNPGLFLNLCVVAIAICGMLFGYDTGVISGDLVVLGTGLDGRLLSHWEKGLITAFCAAGAFIGAIVAGVTADKYGRKPAIWFASVLFTVRAHIQASSFLLVQMCIGRLLVDLGVGSASIACILSDGGDLPLTKMGHLVVHCGNLPGKMAWPNDLYRHGLPGNWISPRLRIRCRVLQSRTWVALHGRHRRDPVLLSDLLFWCPESSRQLLFHGRPDECIRVLRCMYSPLTSSKSPRW